MSSKTALKKGAAAGLSQERGFLRKAFVTKKKILQGNCKVWEGRRGCWESYFRALQTPLAQSFGKTAVGPISQHEGMNLLGKEIPKNW